MSDVRLKPPALPRITILSEFREFIARGNVIDLAVGVIVGAAFNDIVKSLVDNVVMPPIGYAIGGIDFSDLVIRIGNPVADATGNFAQGLKYHQEALQSFEQLGDDIIQILN